MEKIARCPQCFAEVWVWTSEEEAAAKAAGFTSMGDYRRSLKEKADEQPSP